MAVGIKEFLLERIAEDEAVAKTAAKWGGKWRVYRNFEDSKIIDGDIDGIIVDKPFEESWQRTCITHDAEGIMPSVDEDAAPHIARFDPARILAECSAKRGLLEGHADGSHICVDNYMTADNECYHMLYLAAPYSSHPDYDLDWAVA